MTDIDRSSGKVIWTVFLDYRKAFDLVNHKIILHKLSFHNVSTNTFFSDRSSVHYMYAICYSFSIHKWPSYEPLKSNLDMYADDVDDVFFRKLYQHNMQKWIYSVKDQLNILYDVWIAKQISKYNEQVFLCIEQN